MSYGLRKIEFLWALNSVKGGNNLFKEASSISLQSPNCTDRETGKLTHLAPHRQLRRFITHSKMHSPADSSTVLPFFPLCSLQNYKGLIKSSNLHKNGPCSTTRKLIIPTGGWIWDWKTLLGKMVIGGYQKIHEMIFALKSQRLISSLQGISCSQATHFQRL